MAKMCRQVSIRYSILQRQGVVEYQGIQSKVELKMYCCTFAVFDQQGGDNSNDVNFCHHHGKFTQPYLNKVTDTSSSD